MNINELQIKHIFGDKCLILSYKELSGVFDLDETLTHTPVIFLLYEHRHNYGHWTCILKTINNNQEECIEFFDSYGAKPDTQRNGMSIQLLNDNGMEFPKVLYLLFKSSYPIEYNNHKLQKIGSNINTCGRWCIVRSLMNTLTIDEFAKIFKGKHSDKHIVLYSDYFL